MNITKLEINKFQQFKNIKFDFTYPLGHSKEGKPLNKVCFIGQSGTGKTTLLRILREYTRYITLGLSNIEEGGPFYTEKEVPSGFLSGISVSSKFEEKEYTLSIKSNSIKEVSNWIEATSIKQHLIKINKFSFYIADSVANEAESFLHKAIDRDSTKDFIKTNQQLEDEKIKYNEEIENFSKLKGVFIGNGTANSFWGYVLSDINDYDNKSREIAVKIIQNPNGFSTEKLILELLKWKENNISPRISIASECLNPILNKFNLEVDIDNTNAPIVIKTLKGDSLSGTYLSTGTKQVVATALPLYKFDTYSSAILFDEPERSLFPDIQRGLVDYYVSLAPTAQFFFATHSPIIASAFEPCERFILYFDEDGEVKFRNGVAPEGDDPNDILSEDFGMNELMLPKGLEAYDRYRKLGVEIRNEKDPKRKNELIVERAQLGDSYKF
jgi:ABC-type arginine transport system ATPase subunit